MLITDKYSNRELEMLNLIECGAPLWLPDSGNKPQIMAYLSDANVTGFGGAAGGGKSELIIGKALNQHEKTMIVREEGTQMTAIIDRFTSILGGRDGYNGQSNIWRLIKRGQQIEFGSCKDPGDETKYQGRPHDFLAFDEATNIRENQIRYLTTWLRSATVGQVSEMLLTFNPPTTAEGRWVLDYFAPWLVKHTAQPGELRYFVTVAQKDIPVADGRKCIIVADQPVFDFNPADHKVTDILTPRSRTFIPSRVTDNRYYMDTDYMAVLQALPEPLRSQMLEGNFEAGIEDDEWQVIPTAWVKLAMDRWRLPDKLAPMDSMGVDVARGGRDNSIIFRRHGMWFNKALTYPGIQTPDGPTLAGLIVAAMRDRAPVHIDVVGVGSSPYDFMKVARFQISGVVGGDKSNATTREGKMGFSNLKSELWWRAREAFDPSNNTGICVPPDEQLLKDLTALTWRPEGAKIRVESRKEIIKRIGRSPDWGSAFVLALMATPKISEFLTRRGGNSGNYDPMAVLEDM